MMVVRSVNGEFPDFAGNVEISKDTLLYNSSGLVTENVKIFVGVATTVGNAGLFTLDISQAGFSTVDNVQLTVQTGTFAQADSPLSAQYNQATSSSTVINGKAFKATSAGLLAAMQQTPAEAGTKINVLVIGR